MDEHVHTGFWAFFWTGVYAVLFIWALKFIGAKLMEFPATERVGTALGAVTHFGS